MKDLISDLREMAQRCSAEHPPQHLIKGPSDTDALVNLLDFMIWDLVRKQKMGRIPQQLDNYLEDSQAKVDKLTKALEKTKSSNERQKTRNKINAQR